MAMKKVYTCNLCGDSKEPNVLVGLNFKNMSEFTLSESSKTDGAHICLSCLKQLKEHLRNKEITEF